MIKWPSTPRHKEFVAECDGCGLKTKVLTTSRAKFKGLLRGLGWLLSEKHGVAYCPKCRDNIRRKARNGGAYTRQGATHAD